ncbi:MAG: nickel-type superoxide dismutase maturation protease [Anaerolineales bacterium]|nr:nickel-type superoxide dismutase maturation protease [Anaerolineales bacterium]
MQAELKDADLGEFLLWLLRRRWRYRVSGNSMLPVLQPGDEILVDKRAYRKARPMPGDLVVARHPHQKDVRLVKQVVAVDADGRCQLEGTNLLGVIESSDSRGFGPLSPEKIVGRVTSRFA